MSDRCGQVDADAFHRTSALFEAKRAHLAQDAVKELAQDIVRRLSSVDRADRLAAAPAISQNEIAAFCDVLVQPTAAAALDFLHGLQDRGIPRDTIIHGYIAGAARMLGARWDADRTSFFDVAVGTGHLYALMRSLPSARPDGLSALPVRRNALFASVPGETHNIGITIAADTFREAGWDIDLQLDLDFAALTDHVRRTEPAIIGLSLSSEGRLADLVRLVVALRLLRPAAIIGVAPALAMSDQSIRKLADIDIIFRDARLALHDLDAMLRLRG